MQAGPVVSHGANSLKVSFLRKKTVGEFSFSLSGYQNVPIRAEFTKENERGLEKARKQILP